MYKTNCLELRKNNITLEPKHELSIEMNIHWLNPLLLKRKNK